LPISVQNILSQNITLLYDSLDLGPAHIDRNRLREIAGENAMVMDTNEMIVAAQPTNAVIFQLGDRRIRISAQRPSKNMGEILLWLFAQDLNQLVARAKLIAYGFNFGVIAEMERESKATFAMLFLASRTDLERNLSGTVESVVPRIRFKRDSVRYDLILEPQQDKQFIANLNAHFERNALPPQNVLERDYKSEYREFVALLNRVLGG
jgi:hypothetical protein